MLTSIPSEVSFIDTLHCRQTNCLQKIARVTHSERFRTRKSGEDLFITSREWVVTSASVLQLAVRPLAIPAGASSTTRPKYIAGEPDVLRYSTDQLTSLGIYATELCTKKIRVGPLYRGDQPQIQAGQISRGEHTRVSLFLHSLMQQSSSEQEFLQFSMH